MTRCPLVLKLKKLVNEDEWRGKVSYQDYEIEILDASEVEKEINKGEYPLFGCLVKPSDMPGVSL